ncbi:MAG: TolC family protein [Prolixibacteraceae bacterium]|nr:TolC family protein [Prolixibacteraceae bacterium]
MKLPYKLTFLAIFLGFATQAQETLKLQDAIILALKNNYSISLAKNTVAIADVNNSVGNAGMLPKLDVTGARTISINNSHAEYFDGRVRDVPKAQTNNQSAGIQLSWTIFDGMNMFIQRDKLNELEQLSNTQLRGVIENTVAQVSRVYYDIAVQQKILDLYHEALKISTQRKEFAKARLDLGSGSQLTFLQATVDMNADSANYMKQLAVVKNSVSDLNLLLCSDLKTPVLVEKNIPVEQTLLYDDLWNKVQTQSPDLQEARSAINLANLATKELKTTRLPRLSVNTGYSYSKSQSDVGVFTSNRNIGFSAGLTLNYNIFNGFTNNQKLKVARIREESAIQDAELQKMTLEADLQQVYTDFTTNRKLVNFEKENMQFARLNWDIAQEKYKLGALNDVELRETQQKLMDAENRLLQSLFRCKSAEIELMRISGQLSGNVIPEN